VKTVLEKFEEKDAETSFLFVDAIEKLDKIDVQTKDSKKQIGVRANESKKQIVRDLAKNLEGKIPTDTICMEITNHLSGRVSDRFVRECLDERYKDKVYSDNAKKQHPKKNKAIDKLAAVTPLNPAVGEEKGIVDVDDSVSIEEKDKPPTTIDFSVMTDKTIVPVSYPQEHKLNEKTDHSLEEYSSCQEPVDENREVALEKVSQVTIANKMVTSEEPANTHDNEMDKGILHFEFPIYYKKLQNQMALLSRKSGRDGKVWFNGKIEIETGKVISKNFGRIEQQQQQQQDES
jgi:hypothetical protein